MIIHLPVIWFDPFFLSSYTKIEYIQLVYSVLQKKLYFSSCKLTSFTNKTPSSFSDETNNERLVNVFKYLRF